MNENVVLVFKPRDINIIMVNDKMTLVGLFRLICMKLW